MKTEILSQERNVIAVRAEYEAGEIDKAVNKTVRELSGKVTIKGFRRGHVPRKTLELYFGRNKIYMETTERITQEAMEGIVAEYDLDLVATPKFDIATLTEGSPLSIDFTFEVRPEVTLPDLAALEAEKVVYSVGDDQVDEGFKQIMESSAELVATDEDRAATREDIVETLYSSYRVDDDGSLDAIEKNKKNTMTLSGIRKDISEAIVGRKPAEEFSFDIRLEDDYPDPRLSGKLIRYNMEILRFMKRVVPEATDEKIEELSKGQYKTLAEMKSELRRQLELNAKERSDSSLRESAVKAAAEAAEVDIPESMVNRQYTAMRSDQDGRLRHDLGQSLEEYLTKNSLSVDEYEKNLRARAGEIVRNTLVLDALAEKEEISFTSDDLNEEIMRMAASTKVNAQELADAISKDKDEFAAVAMRMRTRNTMNFIASKVQVKEIDPPAPEASGTGTDTDTDTAEEKPEE
ncbi:MAG: trigger factor [Synergistaceae bacterium]|nr:trigger factor [Synergistaceae bacterium]